MKTKIKTETAIIFLALLLLIPNISATSITINMKSSFNAGEEISFDYTLLSTTNQKIQYTTFIDCPNAPLPLLETKNINLTANIPFKENYTYMSKLSESIEPQICRAIVTILSPEKISESKNFSITTNPSFKFNILTCKDADCSNQTRVFISNENIYLDYDSDIEGISTTAVLTYPDKTTEQLTLPSQIKVERVGTYELTVTASKTGYKTITKKIQFGIIEKEAHIKYIPVSEIKPEPMKNQILYIKIGVILVTIILSYIVHKNTKKGNSK